MLTDHNKFIEIPYEICDFSSYSSEYHPKNIKIDNPLDSTSRWSTNVNDGNQYLILRLDTEAIVTEIYFGKFYKMHVCNVREMCIYSYNYNQMLNGDGYINTSETPVLIFKGGLRNDPKPEIFPVDYIHKNTFLLTRFIKICPLQAYGVNFNFSLWHIKIFGINNQSVIKNMLNYNKFILNNKCLKIVSQYLKSRGFIKTHKSLENESGLCLESSTMSSLRMFLISDCFDLIEETLLKCLKDGKIDKNLLCDDFLYAWEKIERSIDDLWPGERGGHATALVDNKIYVQGGWSGEEELDDFWCFDCLTDTWSELKCLADKRSCHQMLYLKDNPFVDASIEEDPCFLFIGKYIKPEEAHKKMNIVLYHLKNGKSENISYEGEPLNMYDNQSVVIGNKIYFFGGKIFNSEDYEYCDLLLFHNKKFHKVRKEVTKTAELTPRIGHGFCFINNSNHQDLFLDNNIEKYFSSTTDCKDYPLFQYVYPKNIFAVFGGIKDKNQIKKVTLYDLDSDTVFRHADLPIKTEYRVILRNAVVGDTVYVLFCYESSRENDLDKIELFKYNVPNNKWTKIQVTGEQPSPRSAHSFQYNHQNNTFYVFGGNKGGSRTQYRINDMWKLKLIDRETEEKNNEKKIRILVRVHAYRRLLINSPNQAIKYLREKILCLLNIQNKQDEIFYKKLSLEIFKKPTHVKDELILSDVSKILAHDSEPTKDLIHFL
ncbi:hypothetical protein EDEG_00566 [Edhazardia aedis USNM 41457]|uniref:Muskelin N-terminal domain-containing protein n=1 Tax=Edhazardia aedis (strain USNM 41457) TaxID=1003232 RepID=J9D016_EDHAE|nr:hypothetical protein EDEG_00566 [Edhazardia aedis USNM 41457]|eukprot:EJW01206.1 hypothetical protein EDEG_00566 [Edhazardia aedis USNM 41457]